MILEHLILARDSSIDRDKNTVSIFDIIEEIAIRTDAQVVSLPVQLFVVLRREKETGRIDEKLGLVALSPQSEQLFNVSVPFVMAAEHKRSRIRVNIDLPLKATGDYKLKLEGMGVQGEAIVAVKFEQTKKPVSN